MVKVEFPARMTAAGRVYHELQGQGLWGYIHNELELGNRADWTIHMLDRQFKAVSTTNALSILVYSNIVQSTMMGAHKHQLLRELFIPHEEHDERQMVEPLHYQWLPVQNRRTEIVEVELGDLNGNVIRLPRGKTLVTIAIRQMEH